MMRISRCKFCPVELLVDPTAATTVPADTEVA